MKKQHQSELVDKLYSPITSMCVLGAVASAIWFDRGEQPIGAIVLGLASAVTAVSVYFCRPAGR